ncbi:MAG: diol dehydratase reactivase ATPase-like domain-containing protein, partial [Nocardioides sp.]
MTISAGLDVGNATTEVVLGRSTPDGLEILGADRAPTRRAKGTPESLAGAVALVRRLQRRTGLRVTRAVAAPLRPVETATGSLPEERPATGRLRVVLAGAPTAGGSGFGSGRPVRFGDPVAGADAVVVVVPSGPRYDEVAHTLSPLARSGRLAGILLEDDEAVLVANRLPAVVPVVDGVSPATVLAATRVALEVPDDGRPLLVLTDPLKLVTLLELDAEELADAAALAAQLFDARNAVVSSGAAPRDLPPAPSGWIELAGSRRPFLVGHRELRAAHVGAARAYALPPEMAARRVDDLWTVDLGSVASSVLARRSAAAERPVAVAAMHASAGWFDPAECLSGLLDIPVETAPSEAVAARAGALTTPGAPADAVVVDLGGGTIDVVSCDGAVVAAGAG